MMTSYFLVCAPEEESESENGDESDVASGINTVTYLLPSSQITIRLIFY